MPSVEGRITEARNALRCLYMAAQQDGRPFSEIAEMFIEFDREFSWYKNQISYKVGDRPTEEDRRDAARELLEFDTKMENYSETVGDFLKTRILKFLGNSRLDVRKIAVARLVRNVYLETQREGMPWTNISLALDQISDDLSRYRKEVAARTKDWEVPTREERDAAAREVDALDAAHDDEYRLQRRFDSETTG